MSVTKLYEPGNDLQEINVAFAKEKSDEFYSDEYMLYTIYVASLALLCSISSRDLQLVCTDIYRDHMNS